MMAPKGAGPFLFMINTTDLKKQLDIATRCPGCVPPGMLGLLRDCRAHIEQLEAQLKAVNAGDLQAFLLRLNENDEEIMGLRAQLTQAQKERDEARAACAAKDKALRVVTECHLHPIEMFHSCSCDNIKERALSSTCGQGWRSPEDYAKLEAALIEKQNDYADLEASYLNQGNDVRRLEAACVAKDKCLREIERHCPCGARPESPNTHPHVIGCPVELGLSTTAGQPLLDKLAALEKEAKENKEYIEDLCSQLCKMEDALGFKNDCSDKSGAFVPTIGPWLERVRDLIAAEGELGDTKDQITALETRLNVATELLREDVFSHGVPLAWIERRDVFIKEVLSQKEGQ